MCTPIRLTDNFTSLLTAPPAPRREFVLAVESPSKPVESPSNRVESPSKPVESPPRIAFTATISGPLNYTISAEEGQVVALAEYSSLTQLGQPSFDQNSGLFSPPEEGDFYTLEGYLSLALATPGLAIAAALSLVSSEGLAQRTSLAYFNEEQSQHYLSLSLLAPLKSQEKYSLLLSFSPPPPEIESYTLILESASFSGVQLTGGRQ